MNILSYRQLKAERKAPARPPSELNKVTHPAEVNNTGASLVSWMCVFKELEDDVWVVAQLIIEFEMK